MPSFKYSAKNRDGEEESGIISAEGLPEAGRILMDKGLEAVSLEHCGASGKGGQAFLFNLTAKLSELLNKPLYLPFLARSPGARDFMFFCRQMTALLGAGITVLHGLRVLAEQVEHPLLRAKLQQVAGLVEDGYGLADSFRQQQGVFPEYLVNMVEAGETGGVLEEVMERLAAHFESQHRLEQKLKNAVAYPRFLFFIAIAVIVFMLTVVLPSFAAVFDRMGAEMPFLTRMLIGLGEGLSNYWYLVLFFVLLGTFLCKTALRTPAGAYYYDLLRLHLPVYGPFYRKVLVSRFCRALGTLLASGVLLLESLEIAKKVTGNRPVTRFVEETREGAAQGQQLAEQLSEKGFFPPLVLEMIRIGELSGTLDRMLIRSAEFYEAELSCEVERFSTVLEPVLVLFMALFVGLIILSILTPMLEVYQLF